MTNIQKLAKTMQSIAYADNQTHGIRWTLSVLHPQTRFNGEMGYSGGLWHDGSRPPYKRKRNVSMSFSFSESVGIHQFTLWRNDAEIITSCVYHTRDKGINRRIKLEDFVKVAIREFGIDELWVANEG